MGYLRLVSQVLMIVLGGVVSGYAFTHFYMPHHLLSGGVVGISLLLNNLAGLPVGLQILLYNIPILLYGLRVFGKRFLVFTAVNVVTVSILTARLPVLEASHDALLSAVFGGLLNGIGAGLAMRAGGSTGGLDVVGIAINRRFSLGVGDVLLGINGVIVALGAWLSQSLEVGLYTLVAMYVSGRVLDSMQAGQAKRTVLIMSKCPDAIASRILRDLHRGATYLRGEGAFTHEEKQVLICVISRLELAELKQAVLSVDPQAFLTVLNTEEVVGRFHSINPLQKLTRRST